MFSGYQPSGYQHSGYQLVESVVGDILLGGGPGDEYHRRHKSYEHLREEDFHKRLAERHARLELIDDEIAQAEERKKIAHQRAVSKLVAKNAAKKLAALEARLQEEISRLRNERVWLMRLIDDDEAMLVILMSMPFH